MTERTFSKANAAGAAPDNNARDGDGYTALMRAAEKGRCDLVKKYLARDGVDVNAPDNNGWTALMRAAERGLCDALELLLAAPGIDVNAQSDKFGDTALQRAAWMGHAEVMRRLLRW